MRSLRPLIACTCAIVGKVVQCVTRCNPPHSSSRGDCGNGAIQKCGLEFLGHYLRPIPGLKFALLTIERAPVSRSNA